MDKIFGFVAPTIRAVVIPMLNIAGAALGTAKDGVENIAKLAEDNKKSSGVIGGVLVWLGLDPMAIHKVSSLVSEVGKWVGSI
jgi:hypothetical protein